MAAEFLAVLKQSIKSIRTKMIPNMVRMAIFMLFVTRALQHNRVNDGPVNCQRVYLCASDTKAGGKNSWHSLAVKMCCIRGMGRAETFHSPSSGTILEFRVHFRIHSGKFCVYKLFFKVYFQQMLKLL